MAPTTSHLAFLTEMGDTDVYNDLALVCGDERFYVHKVIVCSQSPVLAESCSNNLQLDFETGATNDEIDVEGFDPITVRCMIDYMYRGEYEIPKEKRPESQKETMAEILLPHVEVHSIAECYKISRLREYATDYIRDILGDSLCVEGLMEVVSTVYNTTEDAALRQVMIDEVAFFIEKLVDRDDFAQLGLLNEFSLDVIRKLQKQIQKLGSHQGRVSLFSAVAAQQT
ncbi:hypothetical protein ASPWEDRAFT_22970 [Aspergillus wentii DTO 134E9]|uniref:BTB domain-containing protein n=1 Tax=Aspergillus wentii DTO 134E9 TaxID=1073089 RepID=A0A1L9S0Y9_ASPWE|nr:uncharacterized protein ASPWEDRAFT_22970 [Aspergillus wentii DTO 134E9]KAI9931169.1 hypothetical protein MW887_010828 [Aspergillus wentii]OJJ40824.1 hypothetical protein ASPWEDRAFT_22970 [Aspergillus wentii DTO 134E9]